MALNINTKLTNNLNGYLLDAKNVKGTYVVVGDYSELASLPEATIVDGSLAFCQDEYYDASENHFKAGFYLYFNGDWIYTPIGSDQEEGYVEAGVEENVDFTQTYELEFETAQEDITDFGSILDNGSGIAPLLSVCFQDVIIYFSETGIWGEEGFVISQVFYYDNHQYLALLTIDDMTTLEATLSFQELQAGSGGGGGSGSQEIQLKKYNCYLSIASDVTAEEQAVDPSITNATRTLRFDWTMYPKDVENIIAYLAQQGITVSTLDQALAAMKQILENAGTASQMMMVLITFLGMVRHLNLSLTELYENNLLAEPTERDVLFEIDYYYSYSIKYQKGIQSSDNVLTLHWKYLTASELSAATLYTGSTEEVYDEFEVASGGGSSEGAGTDSVGDNYIIRFTAEKTLTNPDDSSDVQTLTDKYQLLISEKIFENFAEGQQNLNVSTLPELVDYVNSNPIYKEGILVYFLIGMSSTCSGLVWKYEYDAGYHLNQLIVQNVDFSQMAGEDYTSMSDWTIENIPDKVGGSGGSGGDAITKIKYHIEVEDSNNNKAIIPISKEAFDKYLVEMNQVGQTMATAMSITWTTLNTIDDLKNTFDDWKSTQLAYACDLAMNLLVKYAYESGENCVLQNPASTATISFAVSNIVTYELPYTIGWVISVYYDDDGGGTPTTSNIYWFRTTTGSGSVANTGVNIDSSATFTYTTETETYGGGSSEGVGGSGKLYQIDLELTRYNYAGTAVNWNLNYSSNNSISLNTDTLELSIQIYESNFERVKAKANELLTLAGESFQVTDINSLVTLLNGTINETQADTSSNAVTLLTTLITYADSCVVNYEFSYGQMNIPLSAKVIGTTDFNPLSSFYYGLSIATANNGNGILYFTYHDDGEDSDFYYGLNCNNSATLTEYGTSGGGGGEVATKKRYTFSINDTLASPLSISNLSQIDTAEMFVEITDEQWSDFKTDVLSYFPSFSSIQTPQDFVDLYNNSVSGVGGGDSVLALLVPYLVDYAMSNQSRCELLLTMDGGDGITLYPTSNIKAFGGILATSFGGTVYNWFDYITGSANSSMNVIEETETIGGASGSGSGSAPNEERLCYLDIASMGGWLRAIVDRNSLNSASFVSGMNTGISNLNTTFSINIPTYNSIDDLPDIFTYMSNLDTANYAAAKVAFNASFFNTLSIFSLSSKALIGYESFPVYFTGETSTYTYSVKYLDPSTSPLAYTTLWDNTTTFNFSVLVNQLD